LFENGGDAAVAFGRVLADELGLRGSVDFGVVDFLELFDFGCGPGEGGDGFFEGGDINCYGEEFLVEDVEIINVGKREGDFG